MRKIKKVKDPNRLRFKDYFGTSIMASTAGISAGLMTTCFMVYLTDYAGLGKWGAVLGSTVLLASRLFDAVNDPLEGRIMDQAKVGKYGKYKPFIMLSFLLTDIFGMLKNNKALQVRWLDALFSGFIWTFLFATALYYIKWAYCANLTTGTVNSNTYGMYSLITSMMMFIPIVLGTFIATPLMKKFGSAVRFRRFLILAQAIPCALLFILYLLGMLEGTPTLFFVCMAVTATAIGADYIPIGTMNIECMDYEIYTSGKDRSALVNACFGFMDKAQGAISSGLVGVVLVAIGYVVDSATDTYLGDLARIPTLLTWYIVIMGLVPGVLGLISWLILKHYPVTDEIRADMNEKLSK